MKIPELQKMGTDTKVIIGVNMTPIMTDIIAVNFFFKIS
tara:strand:- start:49 stop:165 length:117 start_codon:yes stop_codon:yes gene_type:complete